jgi:hypothetical protein
MDGSGEARDAAAGHSALIKSRLHAQHVLPTLWRPFVVPFVASFCGGLGVACCNLPLSGSLGSCFRCKSLPVPSQFGK